MKDNNTPTRSVSEESQTRAKQRLIDNQQPCPIEVEVKLKAKTLYLVYEANRFLPDYEPIDESFMKLFSSREKAVAHAESLRDYYIKECSDMYTYLQEDSVEGSNYAFAYLLNDGGASSDGRFNIIVTELPAPDDE